MEMTVSPSAGWRGVLVTLLRAPWGARAWIDTAQVLAGLPIALLAWTVTLSLATLVLTLAVTAVLTIPFLAALFACSGLFTAWQRARLHGFLGRPLPPVEDHPAGNGWLRRLWAQARMPATWRQLGYHLVSGFSATFLSTVVIGCWTAAAMLATIAAYAAAVPAGTMLDRPLHTATGLILLTLLGLVLLLGAPWIAALAARLDGAMAHIMLSPSRSERLARRVASLSESRADVIDAADTERRRIERDLHDGTQQRLVSLAMNLGMTRITLTDVPEEVRGAINHAHEEAKLALSELRDVVRGLHPAVLDDLGLDAALSGVAARSPVPVRLLVELPRRPSRAVEKVAYFVVSEALSNVAKHARATQVDIMVELADDALLRIIVSDNGRGGADPGRGTGLRGLGQRIRSVDGSMNIDSPPGGPTVLVVELPCAS
jgi:signal transduction histidine kinase